MKKIILLLLATSVYLSNAQNDFHRQRFTPNGLLDTVVDNIGNKYTLSDLMVGGDPNNPTPMFATASQSCSAGYFQLYFEPNSSLTPTQENILCQLFTDISCFIKSPLNSACHTTTNNAKVNVYVTDNSTGTNYGGTAAPLYIIPGWPASPYPGMLETVTWSYINTGIDPYQSIISPLNQMNSFYHLIINVNTAISWGNWYYNLGSTTMGPNDIDFYTTYLHEVTHGLGFASMITNNGYSFFGAANNYYGRYDRFLTDKNHIPLLTELNPAAPGTNLQFIGNITNNINPGNCTTAGSMQVTCPNSVLYISSASSLTVPVTTCACWQAGTSLSHFEPTCYPPGNPYGTSNYFVMAPAQQYAIAKRHLAEEEKKVLCDLGYSVSASYVSPVSGAPFTYTSGACNGISIWGINDGLTNNSYSYTLSPGSSLNIPISALLSNDSPNAVSIVSFSPIYNFTGLSASQSSTSIQLTASNVTNGYCGVALFRYQPKDAAGHIGNITYVYVYVDCGSCNVSSTCDLIQNGGFETGHPGCSQGNSFTLNTNTVSVSCWEAYNETPDIYSANCGVFSGGYFATHNGGGNLRCIQLGSGLTSTATTVEVIRNTLSTPLVPNTPYTMSFWIYNDNSFNVNLFGINPNLVVTFASSQSPLSAPVPTFYPSGLTPVVNYTLPGVDGGSWHHYSTTFTYTGVQTTSFLYFGVNVAITAGNNGMPNFQGQAHLFVDDFSLIPAASVPTFSTPVFCKGFMATNLSQYTGNPGGIGLSFAGPGLTNNGNGNWSLNTGALPAGLTNFTVSQTTNAGCVYTNTTNISIMQVTAAVTPSAPFFPCITPLTSSVATFTASGGPSPITYSWSAGQTTNTIAVSPTVSSVYTVTVQNGSCTATATTMVNVIPAITLTNTPVYLCVGSSFQYLENLLTTGSPTGGVWVAPGLSITANGFNQTRVTIPATVTPGTYTVTYVYTAGTGCALSKSFTMTVPSTPTLNVLSNLTQCSNIPGFSTTLVAAPLPTTNALTYTWAPGPLGSGSTAIVSPTANIIYTVSASNGSCVSKPASIIVNVSNQCCPSTNYVLTPTLSSGNYNGLYAINQDVTITGTVSLTGEFLMAPNVSINVPPGAALVTSLNKSSLHLRSCTSMWNGINVQSGGQIRFFSGDVIEDAQTAINVLSTYNTGTAFATADVQLDNAVFNRNFTSISLQNYSLSVINAMPVGIRGCVFTCRDLQIPLHALNWNGPQNHPLGEEMSGVYTAANPLSTPYTLLNYSPTTLKPPYLISSYTAIQVNNCGYTPPNGSGPYYGIAFGSTVTSGQPLLGGMNIFDNHYMGISAVNSNVSCWGSTFQNSRNIGSVPGTGINAVNNFGNIYDYGSLNLVHPTNTTAGSVKFYDCQRGINTTNLQRLNVGYISMMSNQTTANTPAVTNIGNMGIFISGGYYFSYNIYNSTFLNLTTGVYVGANSVTPPQLQTIFNPIILHGQWWGAFTIENNTFSSGQSIFGGPQYMSNAIAMDNINGPMQFVGGVQPLYMVSPNTGLRIGNNTIDRVWRGIYVNSYNNSVLTKSCVQNTITLIQDNTTGNEQYGIRHNNVYKGLIKANVISSFGTPTVNAAGVYMSMNNTSTVQCNTTSNVAVGFRFDGFNPASFWRNNYMTNHLNGLALRNTGIMGPQGSAAFASDNKWNGSWVSNNKGTYTDVSSTAYNPAIAVTNPSNSVMWVRNTPAGYYPPNNFGVILPHSFNVSGAIQLANNTPQYDCSTNTYISGGGTVTPPGSHREVAVDIGVVQDSLGYSDPRTSEINKFNLLTMMVDDNNIIYGSGITKDFYTDQMSLSKGTLVNAEAGFITSSPSDWAALLDGISATSPLETNYLQFYNLYQNYLNSANDSLNTDQVNQLSLLANRCPFMDGEVVYRARGLYNLAIGDFLMYNDVACPTTDYGVGSDGDNGGGERKAHVESQAPAVPLRITENVTIYPNPAQGEIFIQGPEESNAYTCIITDAQGRVIGSLPVTTSGYQVRIGLNLHNGIYFVSLIDKHGVKTNSKLVIEK